MTGAMAQSTTKGFVDMQDKKSDKSDDDMSEIEDTAWKKAMFIDEVAYWMEEDGTPGNPVEFGTQKWHFQVENDIIRLAPAEDPDNEPDDGPWLDLEAQRDAIAEAMARGDPDDPLVNAVVSDFLRKFPDLVDSDEEERDKSGRRDDGPLDRNQIKELGFRMFARPDDPRHQVIMPIDINGRLDVDFYNTGHEFSDEAQPIQEGLLTLQRVRDNARVGRKPGKGMQRYVPQAKEDELKDIEDVSDASESSKISLSHCGSKERYQKCDRDCWLKQPIPRDEQKEVTSRPIPDTGLSVPLSLSTKIYQQLPSNAMRVLHVCPGNKADPIVCKMEVIQIPITSTNSRHSKAKRAAAGKSDVVSHEYEALSYTWGDLTQTDRIECNGVSLGVTHNLYTALYHLRQPEHERSLWADAVCINQSDVKERNEQVRQMYKIFQGASSVLVWLGSAADDSDYALAGMRLLDKLPKRRRIIQRTHDSECRANLLRLLLAQRSLLSRPWFSRTWIRQEISAARGVIVQCGLVQLPWFTFKRSSKRLEKIAEKLESEGVEVPLGIDHSDPLRFLRSDWCIGDSLLQSTGDIRSVWYYHTGGLLDLLMVGRAFNATDPRDKVYACLGMAEVPVEGDVATTSESTNVPAPVMRIDYSRSISEVYQYLAKFIINRDRNLDILSILPQHRDQTSTELPSWVPDWRVPSSSIPLGYDMEYYTRKAAACGSTEAELQDQTQLGTLKVRGAFIAMIKQLPGVTSEHLPQPPAKPHARMYKFDPDHNVRQIAVTNIGDDDDDDATESDSAAFVPRGTRVGDAIYILYGAKYPMVLTDFDVVDEGIDGVGKVLRAKVVGPAYTWEQEWMFGVFVKHVKEDPAGESSGVATILLE